MSMQLSLFDWQPREGEIVTHPSVWAAIWRHEVEKIAEAIVTEPHKASMYWQSTPRLVEQDTKAAGATSAEAALQAKLWLRELSAAVDRLAVQRGKSRDTA